MMKMITANAKPISSNNHPMSMPSTDSHPVPIVSFGVRRVLTVGGALVALALAGCTSAPTSTAQTTAAPASQAAATGSPECNCAPPPAASPTPPEAAVFTPAGFDELPGWPSLSAYDAFNRFAEQCSTLQKRTGTPQGLKAVCSNLPTVGDEAAARQWWEGHWSVYRIAQADGGTEGLITGYYEPILKGSRQRSNTYDSPLFAPPADMVTVELGSLYPELKNMRLRGRLVGKKLLPYYSQAEWAALGDKRPAPLLYVNGALNSLLIQIQGSGRVQMDNGDLLRLGYADQNGHPYVAVGKVLVQWGELKMDEVSMPAIRAWAEKNPKRVQALVNANPSVVFFSESPLKDLNQGPMGSLGVPLRAENAIAIDPKTVPLGSPVFLATTRPDTQKPFQNLMMAQDTGGAIRGRVRADLFWGWGDDAGRLAGITKQKGQLWMLWPKGVEVGR